MEIAEALNQSVKVIIQVLALVAVILFAVALYLRRDEQVYRTDVAELSTSPKWKALEKFSPAVDANQFENVLTRYYVIGNDWKEYFSVSGNAVEVLAEEVPYRYEFGAESSKVGTRYWRRKEELPARSPEQPLEGIKIALDPGHIGGKCAKMEERWFQIGENLPVMEGEMTLLVAQHIQSKLKKLGAEVALTRAENAPVGRKSSPHFLALAKSKVETLQLDESLTERYAEKIFYRTAEIRARAKKVNKKIQPDLVIALHFNAEGWGDPAKPTLTNSNHFHILLNGAFTTGELKHEDERFELTRRILQGTILEEVELSKAFVKGFKEETQLPPYQYEPNSKRAIKVDEEGYVWSRNLLANRLFECPTIFLEPYIMNSHEVHQRVQLGDYKGTKDINGVKRKSIYQEYADSVVRSLVDYYSAE